VEYSPPLLPGLFERRISLRNDLRAALGRDIRDRETVHET
jgi:hypothetical protein